jgi:Fe-S oxidoreductase
VECFADQTCPRWVGGGDDPSDLAIFHLSRAMHLTGRCTDCGACTAACPVGIDTRLLIREMNRDAEQIYGYRAGVSREGKPLLNEFDMGDPQDFVVEP